MALVIGATTLCRGGVSDAIVAIVEQPRIAVVGCTIIDVIAYGARVPQAGETIQGDDFQLAFVGKVATGAEVIH